MINLSRTDSVEIYDNLGQKKWPQVVHGKKGSGQTLLSYYLGRAFGGWWQIIRMIHTQSNSKQSCYIQFNSQATMVEFHWTALSASIPLLPLVSGFKTFKIQQCKTNAVSRVEPSEIITFCLSSQLAPIFQHLARHQWTSRLQGHWEKITTLPTPRKQLAAVAADNTLYVIGGFDGRKTSSSIELQ